MTRETPADPSENVAPAASTPQESTARGGERVRRGLPRVAGGNPWPPADFTPRPRAAAAPPADASARAATLVADPAESAAPAPSGQQESTARDGDARVPAATAPPASADIAVASAPAGPRAPLPFTPTVFPGAAASVRLAPPAEPRRIGPYTPLQWAGVAAVGGFTLLVAAGLVVVIVRFLLSIPPLQGFVEQFPGEYHLPEWAPVGIPAWLGWQHFFNVFLMVLIIRTGLQVRTEKRPTVFWSPKGNKRRKISLNLWLHQALDVLWVANGIIYVVLLFTTGQWVRIVPTSWEVIPNAVSAGLQYLSLDWPTENGWVNYNSLQQLAYFATVFIAAPLAIITGVRMSGFWPKDAARLNRLYPVEWARKVHFPVMLYFVVFIIFHVTLVFATGALRNLNHMYAAQGSVDPNAYADNWAGLLIFTLSLGIIVAGWVAARPLVVAPIARLFGTVKSR
ncbi:cytochrome b/b6 domain-containing protein [Microbacterium sp. CCNWLW134]|uniref:cytochrome b/b6 domain-containing protein n=1 Tax=Microbacterium sp. CCNWLW134 TaxID=3122064 RepID=UPI0030102EC1